MTLRRRVIRRYPTIYYCHSGSLQLRKENTHAITLTLDLIRRYIESVVMFGNYWIMITSIDGFFHSRPSLDDCADTSKRKMTRFTEAIIHCKAKHGKAYYELSLFVGNLELLTVGGLHGHEAKPDKAAFLGSSIPNLPFDLQKERRSTEIYIKKHPAITSFSNRHVRQYGKFAAGYKWSGSSDRFISDGLYPVNPINYTEHPAGGASVVAQLASFFLQCLASRSIDKDGLERMLFIACTAPVVKKLIDNKKIISFNVINRGISADGHVSRCMKAAISAMALLETRAGCGTAAFLPVLQKMKDTCLNLMDSGYAAKLKTANSNAVRLYNRNHG
ncbi:hypothetical protein BCR43DRAFT_495040 [Syncephalastrum racemosum]|uniref:Uncharacterized protein n=1 Tax=Syncephalastrum racemosum TaxID=13706 RepID=A0A1X2H8Z6_SYNRA|nr:hypothetical protein BCR43DRAFT_495040 [Syncephalastrum racemosum]